MTGLCLAAAAAGGFFALRQELLLRQREAMYLAVEREGPSFHNESARDEIDERLEIVRRLRDGALAISAILLVTPILLRVIQPRNQRYRTRGKRTGAP